MPIPILIAGASLAMKTLAHARSAKVNNQMMADNNGRMKQLDTWRKSELGKDFMDTSAAKSVFTRLKSREKQQGEAANNAAARGGATTDQALATKSAIQKNTGETISRIAGMGTQYKSSINDKYFSRMRSLDRTKLGLQQQKNQNIMNFASNAGKLGSAALQSDGAVEWMDNFGKKNQTQET